MIGSWPTDDTPTLGLAAHPGTTAFAGPAACARPDGNGGFERLPAGFFSSFGGPGAAVTGLMINSDMMIGR